MSYNRRNGPPRLERRPVAKEEENFQLLQLTFAAPTSHVYQERSTATSPHVCLDCDIIVVLTKGLLLLMLFFIENYI